MRRLLVVDDEPKTRWRVQHMVRGFDLAWHSIAASSAQEALEVLTAGEVDLILTDIRMPGIDGLALLEELRRRGDPALVALLSAYADFAYARQALRNGALDYLMKPLDPAELRGLLLKADERLALEGTEEPGNAPRAGNSKSLRTRLLTELLEGSLPAKDWRARAGVLGMASLSARVISISCPSAAQETLMRYIQDKLDHAGDKLAPLVIAWERGRVSLIVLARRAPGAVTEVCEDAKDCEVVGALRRCPVSDLRVGVGGFYRAEEARASYLESMCRLHEQTGVSDRVDQRAGIRPAQSVSVAAQCAIQEACAWVAIHYAQPITLTDLAGVVHLHPKYLSTVFPLVTGCGFGDYLSNVRIEQAKGLLLDRRLSCQTIAEQVGYQNERCFAQAFRRCAGVTPTEYRQAHGLVPVAAAKSLTIPD